MPGEVSARLSCPDPEKNRKGFNPIEYPDLDLAARQELAGASDAFGMIAVVAPAREPGRSAAHCISRTYSMESSRIWKLLSGAVALLTLSCIVSSARATQSFDYSNYQPRRLGDIFEAETRASDPAAEFVVADDDSPSRVRVEYTGKSRALSDERLEVWSYFLESRKMDGELANLLEKEWEFREGDREYWLPVQQQVAAYFEKELKAGDPVDLFVTYVGGVREGGQFAPIVVVNEFRRVNASTSQSNEQSYRSRRDRFSRSVG